MSKVLAESLENRCLLAATLSVEPISGGSEGGPSTLTGSVSGLEANNNFTLDIDWGDGQTEQYVGTSNASGNHSFSVPHSYSDDGNFSVDVSLTEAPLLIGTDAVFVIDVSGSTQNSFAGSSVGDQNNDNRNNTILDAEIAAFKALNQNLIDRGLGNVAKVSIVAFGTGAWNLDMNPDVGGTQLHTTPLADADNNGVRDVDQALQALDYGGSTYYEESLQTAISTLQSVGSPAGGSNVIFISDGVPSPSTQRDYDDEVAFIKNNLGQNIRAFGAGTNVPLPDLQRIDPSAVRFTSTTQLLDVFSGTGPTGGGTDSVSTSAAVTNVAPTVVLDPVLMIDENGIATLSGTITDPGVADTFDVDIDWNADGNVGGSGEGTTSLTHADLTLVSPGVYTFSTTHQYLDDNPTDTAQDTYTIAVVATDDDGGVSTTVETDVLVKNVDPNVIPQMEYSTPEGTPLTFGSSFTDNGADDGHLQTWTVSSTNGQLIPGVTVNNLSGDSDGSGSSTISFTSDDNGTYTMTYSVTDDDGGTGGTVINHVVTNVAPTVVLDPVLMIDENGIATLSGTITDPGVADTFDVDIDWNADGNVGGSGEGTTSLTHADLTLVSPGVYTFSTTHQYLDDNPTNTPQDTYTIAVVATDDDGGVSATVETEVLVKNVDPNVIPQLEYSTPEGTPVTFGSSFTDDGADDGHLQTWTVSSTNGQVIPGVTVNNLSGDSDGSGSSTISFTSDDNGTYTMTYSVTDDDGGTGGTVINHVVTNVAPTVVLNPVLMIDENGIATLSGTITDPGVADTFDVDIDWNAEGNIGGSGEGTTSLTHADLTLVSPGVYTFSTTHQYLDDNPTNTPLDTYTIAVVATDDDGGVSATVETEVLVKNVDPVITSLVNPAEECGHGAEGQPVSIDLEFDDVGSLDEHTIVVDWGDGNVETYVLTVGDRVASLSHTYLAGGIYYIDVDLSDDDTGSDDTSTLAVISGVNILQVNGESVLQIIGTDADDHISINQTGNGQLKVHWDFLGDNPRVFPLANVDRIVGMLCDGDDHLTISGKVYLPTIIDAGAGNDHINGGGGSNILLGGDGDDHLNGGSGRDLLIGGMGVDRLVGGPGEDIMTGGVHTANGSEALLDNYSSLLATQDRWLGDIDGILSGDDVPLDDAALAAFFASVGDDGGAADKLTGSSSRDWVLLFDGDVWTDQNSKGNGKKKK